MSKFKAGDLALMKKAWHQENVGRCVELVCVNAAYSKIIRETAWIVKGEGPGAWAPESWLMPLRGDFQPEQQKSREVPA